MIGRFLVALIGTPILVILLLLLIGVVYPLCGAFAIVRYRYTISAQAGRYGEAVAANVKDCFRDIANMWGRI